MSKPENVRCETCVFWVETCRAPCLQSKGEEYVNGNCRLMPQDFERFPWNFCRQWRDTWPSTRVFYQILPDGTVVPMSENDEITTLEWAIREVSRKFDD